MDKIFKGLNEQQIRAVKIIGGPVLVISGPGSGKTKCLTHRIAFLIEQGIRPQNILAVTFTNKAAEEMKERVSGLLGYKYSKNTGRYLVNPHLPLIGTFHSICLKILRREIQRLGYGPNFTIADTEDQIALVKKVMAELEIDSEKFNPKAVLAKISESKTELKTPIQSQTLDFFSRIAARVYKSYQSKLFDTNSLDFDDLIFLTVKIFRQYPQVLEKYQNLWKYLLVDEYQDTSHDQYTFITLLAKKCGNIFCIGDDAQSIYQFRQADIRNILNFQKDYPEAAVILLEQNYRSTKNIIAAAQEIISRNKNQIPKALWTANDTGQRITVKETLNERAEANFVISKIIEFIEEGFSLNNFAVLYRTHAQSRAIEEALISCGMPYQIVGGTKFYERREIKDILAYLKLAHNPADIISLERVINVPPRGIGKISASKIIPREGGDLMKAIAVAVKNKALPEKQTQTLKNFLFLIEEFRKKSRSDKLTPVIKFIIKKTGYENYLKNLYATKASIDSAEERIKNLRELLTVTRKYDLISNKKEGVGQFLEEVALLQKGDEEELEEKKVTLMTIHASKGLEFPVVFIVGMEEGLFPQNRAVIDPQELEEERRLCYVAVTRAKQRLILTHAKYRNIFGSSEANLPSRFISEMPTHVADYHWFDLNDENDTIFY